MSGNLKKTKHFNVSVKRLLPEARQKCVKSIKIQCPVQFRQRCRRQGNEQTAKFTHVKPAAAYSRRRRRRPSVVVVMQLATPANSGHCNVTSPGLQRSCRLTLPCRHVLCWTGRDRDSIRASHFTGTASLSPPGSAVQYQWRPSVNA